MFRAKRFKFLSGIVLVTDGLMPSASATGTTAAASSSLVATTTNGQKNKKSASTTMSVSSRYDASSSTRITTSSPATVLAHRSNISCIFLATQQGLGDEGLEQIDGGIIVLAAFAAPSVLVSWCGFHQEGGGPWSYNSTLDMHHLFDREPFLDHCVHPCAPCHST